VPRIGTNVFAGVTISVFVFGPEMIPTLESGSVAGKDGEHANNTHRRIRLPEGFLELTDRYTSVEVDDRAQL
jgi:hypothetical protein